MLPQYCINIGELHHFQCCHNVVTILEDHIWNQKCSFSFEKSKLWTIESIRFIGKINNIIFCWNKPLENIINWILKWKTCIHNLCWNVFLDGDFTFKQSYVDLLKKFLENSSIIYPSTQLLWYLMLLINVWGCQCSTVEMLVDVVNVSKYHIQFTLLSNSHSGQMMTQTNIAWMLSQCWCSMLGSDIITTSTQHCLNVVPTLRSDAATFTPHWLIIVRTLFPSVGQQCCHNVHPTFPGCCCPNIGTMSQFGWISILGTNIRCDNIVPTLWFWLKYNVDTTCQMNVETTSHQHSHQRCLNIGALAGMTQPALENK